jgi:charged multivesicular body protein 1
MDKFETQFEDLDVQSSYMENAMGTTTATATPQDEVDLLMQKVADEAGLEMNASLTSAETPRRIGPTEVEEDRLGERLRALRG